MNTFWVHKNWKWKKENATAKYIDAQCEEAVTLSDAQATIAALEETILKMGENAAVVAKDAMAAKEQVAALQAERDEYKTMYACLTGETYDNPIADLKAQLTQRTAELEAANKLLYRKNCALGRAETIINDLQAELERVSLLSSHNERRFEEVDKKYKELREQNRVLREALQAAKYELAALFPIPSAPTVHAALEVCGNNNEADARCIYLAYEAICAALTATSQPAPPYKEWCRHPDKCAGLASCPQDPTCAD